jgi:hypothetical protein
MNANSQYIFKALIVVCSSYFVIGCEAPPAPQSLPQDITKQISTVPFVSTNESPKTIDSLKARLLESYSLYWPLISSEHQHEQLPSVLGDPLPELREFGIERVAVLLRDGDATDEELQLVVDLLRDPSPSVRFAAAKLLPEINVPGLSEYVANSLAIENDLLVIKEELLFFMTRPHPKAIEPTIALLSHSPVDSAANTLIVLLNANEISDDTKHRIVKTVQKSRRSDDSPSLITLEAMLGSKTVQQKLIRLLEHQDEEIRLAVAEGFASAGYAQPLIERAENPELYEYALTALQGRVGIESFKQLMDLYLPDNDLWNASAFSIATALDTSSLLRADDMLERIGMNELRLQVLGAIWEKASEKSLAARKAIARRAVPLMISSDDAVGALQLLDVFGESLVDEDLLTLRFKAAISASAWDAAADAKPTPEPWIVAWELERKTDPTAASVIRQQLTSRFKDELTPEQRELLGIVQVDATPNQDQ